MHHEINTTMLVNHHNKNQYNNYMQEEIYPHHFVQYPISQTIAASELVDLQNDMCEENARLWHEVHRINTMFVKIKAQNKQNKVEK